MGGVWGDLREVAGDEVMGGYWAEFGVVGAARGGLVEVAAGMEGAPGRHVDGTRYVAGEQCQAGLGLRHAGDGGQQGLGVGVGGGVDDGLGGADLDDLAEVHDGDALGHVGDDADVV